MRCRGVSELFDEPVPLIKTAWGGHSLFKLFRSPSAGLPPDDALVDKAAEEVHPDWRKDIRKWATVGGDFGHHYMGSAIWFTRIAHAMGEAMLELLGKQAGR